jgi:tellurite resistance protein TerC
MSVIQNHTSASAWIITLAILAAVLLIDFVMAYKARNIVTTLRSVALWTAFYVAAAIGFGISLGFWSTHQSRSEFFAGWITEYSLSFDNLFVLLLIMAKLKVEKEREQIILFWGILTSLLLRGIFIAGGSALVNRYVWIFYIFGSFLIYTAVQLFRESESEEWEEGRLVSFMKRRGVKLAVIAMISISLTNVLFALDSIPAIFGLTRNPYVIVTATIFASMGLRQLYFLIGDLMGKLIYLSEGLSVILAFIGFKLVCEAAASEGHHKVAGVKIPDISLGFSLGFVVSILVLTALMSAIKVRRHQGHDGDSEGNNRADDKRKQGA